MSKKIKRIGFFDLKKLKEYKIRKKIKNNLVIYETKKKVNHE